MNATKLREALRQRLPTRLGMAVILFVLATVAARDAAAWVLDLPETNVGVAVFDPAGDILIGEFGSGTSGSDGVSKRDGTTGAPIWRVDGLKGFRFATDAAGDVFAVVAVTSYDEFTVVKLSGVDGSELWRTTVTENPPPFRTEIGLALAVTATGDVVAAGAVQDPAGSDFAVARLSGVNGAEQWRYVLDGSSGPDGAAALDVALDQAGDVVAVGRVSTSSGSSSGVAVKLDEADGTEIWREVVAPLGGPMSNENLLSVGIDANDDVVGGGHGSGIVGRVLKLAGSTGAELWQATYPGLSQLEVAVDPANDVIAAATLAGGISGLLDVTVVKLSAAAGAELWRRDYFGPSPDQNVRTAQKSGFAVDAAGDPVIGAFFSVPSPSIMKMVVAKLSGSTGGDVWSFAHSRAGGAGIELSSTGAAVAWAHEVGLSGTAVLAKLSGALAGKGLRVVEAPIGAVLVAKSTDPAILAAAPGGSGDPTAGGGVLTLANPVSGETASVVLPAAKWVRSTSRPGTYTYRDPSGVCRKVALSAGRSLSARCVGVAFSLDEASQGTLALTLTTGGGPTTVRHCAVFGGTVVKDQLGAFIARNAAPPLGCP